MKKLTNKILDFFLTVTGYILVVAAYAFMIAVPITGVAGCIWLLFKMFGG